MPSIFNEEKLDNVDQSTRNIPTYISNKFSADVIITDGGRTAAEQIATYKKLFDRDWEKHMPKDSAHVFIPGLNKACAVDFTVRDVFITKVHAELLYQSQVFGIKGIGYDPFKNYIHVDRKDRGINFVKLWIYLPDNSIVYLN